LIPLGLSRILTTDFEALYAYKCGEYQRCLQLSTHNVLTLIADSAVNLPCLVPYPEFIQLLDDDIVSLIGLMSIVDASFRDTPMRAYVRQLYLSLYLMTQCQMKLRHSVTSLAQTLHYVGVARRGLDKDFRVDQLLLKLTERKIRLCIIRELA